MARRLAERPLPPGVEVAVSGIRGLDLAYALQGDYAAAILVDAMPRGGAPGALYLVEPEPPDPRSRSPGEPARATSRWG